MAGGFDTSYRFASGEDFDLTFRVSKMGYKLRFVDKTCVYHNHPYHLSKYLIQQFFRGYERVRLYLKNKELVYKSESYSGYEGQVQFLLVTFLIISIFLISLAPFLILIALLILFLSNLPLGFWSYKKEKKFLIAAPIIAGVRSVAGALGAYAFMIRHIGGR